MKSIYYQIKNPKERRGLIYFLLIIGLMLISFLIYFSFFHQYDPKDLGKSHFLKHLSQLEVPVDSSKEELKQGIENYNQRNYEEAISILEVALQNDQQDYNTLEAIGLAHFAILDYEIAFRYFSRMTNLQNVESNEGLFLQALVFMQRDEEGDREEAKFFLNQVVKEKAKGTEFAQNWLKKF
jgi:tetratricopeptide (TPR) repeat protein